MRGTKSEVRPGVWRLRVVTGYDSATGNARQASKTFTGGRKAADTALAEFVTEVEKGSAALAASTRLDDFLDRWLDHIEGLRSPTTVRGYREKLKRVRRDLGSVRVGKLTAQQIDRAYRKWLDEGTSAATVHGIHRVLSAALHQAAKWAVMPQAPTDRATAPSRKARPIAAVDPSTVVAIVEASREDDPVLSAAVVVAATTGVRRGELCGLRWPDLDLETATLHIQRAVKYGRDRAVIEGPTKTHQERRISLDPGTVSVLREHRDRMEAWARAAMVEFVADGYVLTLDPSGRTPWLPDSFGHAFQRYARKTGVKIRLHDLRHFSVTQLIAAGVDVRTVAGRHGHADPSVTLKVYSQFVAERDRQAASVLGALVNRY